MTYRQRSQERLTRGSRVPVRGMGVYGQLVEARIKMRVRNSGT
jgi:hypothetical protein